MLNSQQKRVFNIDNMRYLVSVFEDIDEMYLSTLTHRLYEELKKNNSTCSEDYQDKLSFEELFEFSLPESPIIRNVKKAQVQTLIESVLSIPFPPPQHPSFKFIDLFAGIGGFRLALQSLGGECVFSSEWDKQAQITYAANFGEIPYGDITKDEVKSHIPHGFNVLCAGFPCQAFSIAGRRGGFEDTRGTLFFDVAEIIKNRMPEAIFLENVKGLTNHDKGRTLETILSVLRDELGYFVPNPKIINAKDFGVPQNRERIFIVGFRSDLEIESFNYPTTLSKTTKLSEILEVECVSSKYYLSTQYLSTLKKHKQRHEGKGNGFGYEILDTDKVSNAIVVGGMGRERNLIVDKRLIDFTPVTKIKGEVNREYIRRMTPREWARLQGYPDEFQIPVSDASAYKQFGNSVAVPAIRATAMEIIRLLKESKVCLH